jgi:hypothetical protein
MFFVNTIETRKLRQFSVAFQVEFSTVFNNISGGLVKTILMPETQLPQRQGP